MNARRLVYAVLAGALVGCVQQPAGSQPGGVAPVERGEGTAHVEAPRAGHACLAAGFPTRFDRTIAKAQLRFLPLAWQRAAPCGLRAQLAAESALNEKWCERGNPHGTSASCIGQITKAAAADIERRAGILHSRTNPQASVRASAWYLAAQGRVWSAPRSDVCRLHLARATYHSGAGPLLAGQRRARAAGRVARCYDDGIGEYMTAHKAENNAYVARIQALEARMQP